MSNRRVSVLLSSRNGERYLESALRSIERQTWDDVEIILVDDGSTDSTRTIMQAFADRHLRTHALHTDGIGLAGALHRAAEHATGTLLARHDDDDLSHPERFRRQIDYLDAHPDVGVLGTAAGMIDDNGDAIGRHAVPLTGGGIRAQLERGSPFVHGSVMMRRESYEAAGGYRAAFAASQDYDLWLRMPRETDFANLSEPLYSWRLNPQGVFATRREDQLFFSALAKTFAVERRRSGTDSMDAFEAASTREAFLRSYADRSAFLACLGESYVRDGRCAEARRWLNQAFAGAFPKAAFWWLASFPAGLLPRAQRGSRRAS